MTGQAIEPLVDVSLLEEINGLNDKVSAGLVSEILVLFEKKLPERLQLIQLAVDEKNRDEVVRQTHALKSASSTLGMVELGLACDLIAKLALESEFDVAKEVLSRAVKCADEAIDFIKFWSSTQVKRKS